MTADWFVVLTKYERCGHCLRELAIDSPARRLRTGGLRCPDCAKRLLGEDVPSHLQPTTTESTQP